MNMFISNNFAVVSYEGAHDLRLGIAVYAMYDCCDDHGRLLRIWTADLLNRIEIGKQFVGMPRICIVFILTFVAIQFPYPGLKFRKLRK